MSIYRDFILLWYTICHLRIHCIRYVLLYVTCSGYSLTPFLLTSVEALAAVPHCSGNVTLNASGPRYMLRYRPPFFLRRDAQPIERLDVTLDKAKINGRSLNTFYLSSFSQTNQ